MAGLIPRSFIDDLIDRVDIVEVIDARVKLKKSGKNYSACCPFHDEKTPSFTVSPDKQFYYCFGCGASGNAMGFVMEYERITFPEAVESIAKTVGVDVPREETADPKQRAREQAQEQARKSLYELMDEANSFYQSQLREHPQKARTVDYLKRRGLSGLIARDFGIGYAPPGWENLVSAVGNTNQKQDLLLEAGMLILNEEKERLYDRFRDRVMFPIRDVRGRVVGFGGRVLTDEKPKYLNSPETPIFHKGKELYGLYEARQAHKQLPRLLVVEGYMDVVALAQFDIRYGVATLGTACGEDHLTRAFRYVNEVVFCFDGDQAGRKAARRAMEVSLPVMEDGRQIKFLYLPEGEDPDTLVRQVGAQKFTRMIEEAIPLETFLFEEISQGLDVSTMEGRARLCKLAVPYLDQLPTGIYRELMFNQLANRTQLSVDAVLRLIEELPEKPPLENHAVPKETVDYSSSPMRVSSAPAQPQPSAPPRVSPELAPDEMALSIVLFHPKVAQDIDDYEELRESSQANEQLLVNILDFLKQRPHCTTGQLLGHWQGSEGMEAAEKLRYFLGKGVLFSDAQKVSNQKETVIYSLEAEFADSIKHLIKQSMQQRCQSIIQQLNQKPHDEWTESERQLYQKAIIAVQPK